MKEFYGDEDDKYCDDNGVVDAAYKMMTATVRLH